MGLPEARREFNCTLGRMIGDTLQHVDQVFVRSDVMESAGCEQTLDDGHVLRADLGPAESSQPRGVAPPGCSRNRT